MCGIVGIVSLGLRDAIDGERLLRMRDALAHRGPDGAGAWADGPVALGHRRLAIVDVAGGHQPMSNEDGSVWLTFNGEIYNHADLRPGLEARGHVYRTRSDTETILHLYEELGERVVERLHGMFALAIWDRRRRRLLLARDRLGIKPLYYAISDGELLFASEIKAIVEGGVRPELNRAVVPELLATRYVSGEETLFQGIRKLPPGHTLCWSQDEGFVRRQYWEIPAPRETAGLTYPAAVRELRERLEAAVGRHLMSDVPLGLFLSGGLDSSALAGLTSRLIKEPLRTFSVGFAEEEANELPYARAVARHIGAVHHEVLVSPGEYFDALPQLVWQEDEPIAFTSSVPLYFVSKLARDHVKVVLTGEGSDELFLGYNRYRVTYWNQRIGAAYWAVAPRSLRRRIQRLIPRLPARARRYLARTFLGLEPGPRSLFLENFALFPDRLRQGLLHQEAGAAGRDPFAAALHSYLEAPGDALDRMSRSDLQTYLHELLMKQDQMSMAASIESRVPFLDHPLLEFTAGLPDRLKIRGLSTKHILRESMRPVLPQAILNRPKMGFPVPFGDWLRGEYGWLLDEYVLSRRSATRGYFDPAYIRSLVREHMAGADHGERLWSLLNFEIWQRVVLEAESTELPATAVASPPLAAPAF
jgi:asparagine synthase (glutamine-hydrolysing)